MLVLTEARPQRDEQGSGVLDEQRDTDGQPFDGDEVEPLDEREADDAVEREDTDLGSGVPQPLRRPDTSRNAASPTKAPADLQLGEALRGETGEQDDLAERAVDAEQDRGRRRP